MSKAKEALIKDNLICRYSTESLRAWLYIMQCTCMETDYRIKVRETLLGLILNLGLMSEFLNMGFSRRNIGLIWTGAGRWSALDMSKCTVDTKGERSLILLSSNCLNYGSVQISKCDRYRMLLKECMCLKESHRTCRNDSTILDKS